MLFVFVYDRENLRVNDREIQWMDDIFIIEGGYFLLSLESYLKVLAVLSYLLKVFLYRDRCV
ncbi:hypothetical protein AT238_07520 [Bartonella henselae]|nr:hypothetical protein AT244_04650 [Bartonella henselae]OLL52964.1 hypothetical protein AT238_07520 [Bartonella henselae]